MNFTLQHKKLFVRKERKKLESHMQFIVYTIPCKSQKCSGSLHCRAVMAQCSADDDDDHPEREENDTAATQMPSSSAAVAAAASRHDSMHSSYY